MQGSDSALQPKTYESGQGISNHRFGEIVGCSSSISRLFEQIAVVAPTPATVLIEGETGTGKELVARAIHFASSRARQSFVKVNCSAIPGGLLESELFGYERGAFTGATGRKAGRVELANEGTLFLDEVGDLPLELQPKLLRVLQEHEFDRLGSTRTTHVNVRLIAATNHNLQQLVTEKQFRRDLFYRLRVFPIHIPPLRNRCEDIPLLVQHFIQRCAARLGKRTPEVTSQCMNAMIHFRWPGNIRELENFIERCVILTEGSILHVPLQELTNNSNGSSSLAGQLEQMEKENIVRALRETNWVVSGPRGAAAKLGMKRTTLASRMSRLGISSRPSS